MRRCKSLLNRLVMAALVSALAALLMVAVGPGFAENDNAPNENASERAQENAADEGDQAGGNEAVAATSSASEDGEKDTPSADAQSEAAETTFDPDASSTADSHGHIGAGTGNPEGSQADPGHHDDKDLNNDGVDDQHDGTDGKTNGPGTGDQRAEDCPNDKSSVNDAEDNDFSGAGANKHGPYDSTCDGRISQNGQGSDAPGGGTPCAGCVGNADDKNPPGQVREFYGTKKNDMGYECDGNQGVGAHYGNGNPAHTGDCGGSTTTVLIKVCRQNSSGVWEIKEIPSDEKLSTDKTAPSSNNPEDCDEDTFFVCRKVNGEWTIEEITEDEEEQGDKPAPESMNPEDCAKVTICHATGSATNPFVIITVSENALKRGHDATHGDLHPVDASNCVSSEDDFRICHVNEDGSADVVTVSGGDWEDENGVKHKSHKNDGDRVLADNETAEVCVEDDDDCVDDTNTSGDECKKVEVCHREGNGAYKVIEIAEPALAAHLANHADDKYPVPAGAPASCTDQVQATLIHICYQLDNGTWDVKENIPLSDIGNYRNAKQVSQGTPKESCEQAQELCPPGTDMAGQPMPPGGVNDCDDDDTRGRRYVYVCHATGTTPAWTVLRIPSSSLSSHLAHGDKVVSAGTNPMECEDAPETEVCPEGTDMAGQPLPADLECNEEPPETLPNRLCPPDSDRPMRVIPTGQDETWCDDEVQGEVLERPATPKRPEPGNNVAPNRLQNRPETAPSRQPRGGILPFTGASVLAFLVLALQLIAAGTLILRGKRA